MEEIERLGYGNLIHLASGGEGEVYTCEKQDVKYIVKIVNTLKDEQIDMLKRVNALRNEYYPCIVDIIVSAEKTIIIREYIEGTTLTEEIKKNGAFAYRRAKEIIFDICSALHVLHVMKPNPIIYRDLKPDNVIITPTGKVKLIDFGIARYHKQDSICDTVLAGTKGYTAPEVMTGMQSDERSDIYSIGLIFYELLSGRSLQDPPYQIRPVAENNEFIPDYLDEIIAKATDIDQTKRYASIDEFIYVLENIKNIKVKQKKKRRKRRYITALAVVGLLAAAAVLAFPLLQQHELETILDLQFDNAEDADWLEIHGPDAENTVPQDCVADGAFLLEQEAMLKYALEPGQIVHIRAKASGIMREGSVYFIDLNPVGAPALPRERPLWLRFNVGSNEPYRLEAQRPSGYASLTPTDSAMLAHADEMVDVLVWLDDQDQSVRYIISDPNSATDIACIGIVLDDEFVSEGWNVSLQVNTIGGNDASSGSDVQTEIEFIRVSSGLIKTYLEENVPAYTARKERVDAFLSQPMPLISELDYMPYE